MQNRIVLISDDSDFFEYVLPKLSLRKSDELYRFGFDSLPECLDLISTSLLIINSESSKEKTLEIIKLVNGAPCIVFSYNEDDDFKIKAYKAGMLNYFTLMTSDEEFTAKLVPALNTLAVLEKNSVYRNMLVKKNVITDNNEVFIDYSNVLDRELEKIEKKSANAVLMAISPNDKTKFLLKSNQIETAILTNIRKNDILMTYAPNKYFLLLYDTNIDLAKKIWEKIRQSIPEKIYAGFAAAGLKSRQQLINEALNRLHEDMNRDNYISSVVDKNSAKNFKIFRQEFNKKLDKVMTPVFYQIQQKYNHRLFGMSLEQFIGDGNGVMTIKGKHASGSFKISTPGLSKINIDITYEPTPQSTKTKFPQAKRINIEPDELEAGLLEDLLEQFIVEFKSEVNA